MAKHSGAQINEQWQRVQDALATRDAAYLAMRDPCRNGCIMNTTGDPDRDCGSCYAMQCRDPAQDRILFADSYDEWMTETAKYLEMLK